MEIERKFLLNEAPHDIGMHEHVEIEQAYISIDPTVRLRKRNNEYYLTVKQNGLLAREEMEIALTEKQFKNLWDKIETNVIQKTRALIPLQNGLTAEIDIYHGVLQGLMTVEVEFDSIAQANSFIPPGWFGRDVTDDPKYNNSSLAVNGFFPE